ncbi:MAG: hypothetical protein K5857_06995, partial [Lachnospiraceae bacterium]|nr:hypothetical protein [Lachnospiraceae bacterium]
MQVKAEDFIGEDILLTDEADTEAFPEEVEEDTVVPADTVTAPAMDVVEDQTEYSFPEPVTDT